MNAVKEEELPEGWAEVALCDVVLNVPNVKPESEPGKEFGYVDISAIDNSQHTITETKRFRGVDAPSRARRPIQHGDVLFSNVRTYLRNIAIVPEGLNAQLCSTGFTVLRPSAAVDPRFLFRYTLTDRFIDAVTPHQTGTHYPATSDRVVLSQSFPLPPLAEQRRIVAKVEELLARVNAARERLAKVPAILKRFRQSILAAACSGQLTADWRKESNAATDGSAQLESGSDYPHEIPNTWSWKLLDALCSKITDGEHLTPPRVDSGIPILSAKDVRENGVDFSDARYVDPDTSEKSRQRCDPEFDDVLVVSRGATVGRTCRVNARQTFCLMGSVLLFKPDRTKVLPSSIEFTFKSPRGLKALIERSGATAQQAIYIRDMRTFPVPVAPLDEQQEVKRRVEALFALADKIESRVQAATARVEKITQAILAKAFRGELVPTEAELARRENRPYEPASALLDRIRAERAAAESNGSPHRRGESKSVGAGPRIGFAKGRLNDR